MLPFVTDPWLILLIAAGAYLVVEYLVVKPLRWLQAKALRQEARR